MHAPDHESFATKVAEGTGPLLLVDQAEFRRKFDRLPFLIGHRLVDHPLLQLPRLIELARALPEESVEYNSGELDVHQDASKTPRTGLSIEETLRQIEHRKSWMVLKDIETDPEYAALLDACLDPLQALIDEVAPGMHRRHGFLFVSSPGATTPFHVDFEHNFLLQLRGSKCITVWDGEDRSVMSEVERERRNTGAQRNLPYHEAFAAKGYAFQLEPGMGVQVPLSSPHWVKVDDQVSISLSVTFLTKQGADVRNLHVTNAFLRRHGMRPSQVGSAPVGDFLKRNAYRAFDLYRRARRKLFHAPGNTSAQGKP